MPSLLIEIKNEKKVNSENIKHSIRTSKGLKNYFLNGLFPKLKKIFGSKRINYKDIPIIINNYNRLEMLTKLIHGLENKGYHNLYIIDNQSTYPHY